jgi:hypothetical protein
MACCRLHTTCNRQFFLVVLHNNINVANRVRCDEKIQTFHGMCDYISSELQDFAVTLFTNGGSPWASVPSVHQALTLKQEGLPQFLYIHEFELNPKYRIHANVGTRALRSLLTETALVKRWPLAVCLPCSATQISGQQKMRKGNKTWQDSDPFGLSLFGLSLTSLRGKRTHKSFETGRTIV